MHNRNNIVLMFLIVMLSFAIVSEVSAVSPDDAEPGESCLNVPIEPVDSTGAEIPSERPQDMSDVPVDRPVDNPHSSNDQTSLRDAPHGAKENMTLYEHLPTNHENTPHKQTNHDSFDNQKVSDSNGTGQGEKMNNINEKDLNVFHDLRSDRSTAPCRVDNDAVEVVSDVISNLIGLDKVSVAFKNNKNGHYVSGDVLPHMMNKFAELSKPIENTPSVGKNCNSSQFGRDLSFKKNNSPMQHFLVKK